MFFAELGSRVIKIENPNTGGDITRGWKLAAESEHSEISAYFSAVNWGKESLALDLTKGPQLEILHRLASKADILIQNFKSGAAEKLGVDYKTLSRLNSKLIYAEISAYGSDDSRAGFDAVIQAESGFTYINGSEKSGSIKMPVALTDLLTAHQVKEAVLIALLRRTQSAKGSHICASLLRSAVCSLANQAANWLAAGVVPQRIGSEHPNIAPYGTVYETKDGKEFVLAVGTDKQFEGAFRSSKP